MTTYRFAGFWRRFVAYMIDGFIISVIFTFFMIIATVAFIAGALSNDGSRLMTNMLDPAWVGALLAPIWVFSIILNIAYFTYFHGSTGRTPGKSVMGLQVISAQGTPVSYGTAFLRSVGYLVSSLVFCLGFIWIGFDKRKQGWHDKIAGTVVIIRHAGNEDAGITVSEEVSSLGVSPAAGRLSTDIVSAQAQTPPASPGADDADGDGQKIP